MIDRIAKSAYVAVMRVARGVVKPLGLLGWLERRKGQTARWLRSLFAIHDIDDMVRLDLPWWTFRAIDAAENFLAGRPDARVFEFGSGASTLWLAKRAAGVISVDHDAGWHDLVRGRLPETGNVTLVMRPADPGAPDPAYLSEKSGYGGQSFQAYASEIDHHEGLFDLIVIDGRARVACLRHALAKRAPGGMILFDNSGRARYRDAIDGSGLAVRRLGGLTVALPVGDETTLLGESGNAG
ncbi:MAG: class I SAM-dependent methyltransferase [Pseudomonadota bacterium]